MRKALFRNRLNMPIHFLQSSMLIWFFIVTICISFGNGDILVYSLTDPHKYQETFRDLPARFGDFLPVEGMKGLVVYSDPPTACQEIKGPPANETEARWIVLIARLNCSFEIKVRNAQKAGYDAAIVHNVNSNELEPMSAKDSIGIFIPSVFVSEFTGLLIKERYLYDKEYFVLINDLPLNINTHLLLPFAIVVGMCFLVMVIFMIVRCIKDRRRQRRHRLPNSSLKKIPTHKYTKGDPYETCAICLDDYVEGEKLRVLPCAHAYHAKCIDPWLTKNRRVCPVCKRKVFAADEKVETDSESDSDADDSTPLIRNSHSGTQGGTFTPQRDNPFLRVHRPRQRRDSENSGSSYDSNHPAVITSDDGESTNVGEGSGTVFLVSGSQHSISVEPDLERSISNQPHTLNLSTEVDDISTSDISITNERYTKSESHLISTSPSANIASSNDVVPHESEDTEIV